MRTWLGTTLAAAVLLLLPQGASAAPILVSQSQVLTVDGQDTLFAFAGLAASDGSGGVITVFSGPSTTTAGLDLSGAFPLEDENFEATFDGVSQGFFSCGGPSNNGATAIPGATDNSFNFNDCVFSQAFSIGGAAFDALIADGVLNVGVLFGDDVSLLNRGDQVGVSLSYNSAAVAPVPEPASLILLGSGIAGFAAKVRRRRQQQPVA